MTSVFELALAELAKRQQPAPPMFAPEQIQARVGTNNSQVDLGLLGSMAPDRAIGNVGGSVLKQALAARDPIRSVRGVTNPLTGETALDPAYTDSQEEARRDRILKMALAYEDQRQRAQERADRQADADAAKLELKTLGTTVRASAAGNAAANADLKRALLEAQIDRVKGLTEASAEKAQQANRKTALLASQTAERAELLAKRLSEAEKLIDWSTTGLVGSQIRKVPGTDAYNLNAAIESIKANIGFQELAEMRQSSPTGGALGQVAIRELDMLQSVLGNLDPRQDPDTLRKTMREIRARFEKISTDMRSGARQLEAQPPAPAPAEPAGAQPRPPAAPGAAPRIRLRLDPVTGELVPAQ